MCEYCVYNMCTSQKNRCVCIHVPVAVYKCTCYWQPRRVMSLRIAVHYSVAVCCSVLQCIAMFSMIFVCIYMCLLLLGSIKDLVSQGS